MLIWPLTAILVRPLICTYWMTSLYSGRQELGQGIRCLVHVIVDVEDGEIQLAGRHRSPCVYRMMIEFLIVARQSELLRAGSRDRTFDLQFDDLVFAPARALAAGRRCARRTGSARTSVGGSASNWTGLATSSRSCRRRPSPGRCTRWPEPADRDPPQARCCWEPTAPPASAGVPARRRMAWRRWHQRPAAPASARPGHELFGAVEPLVLDQFIRGRGDGTRRPSTGRAGAW